MDTPIYEIHSESEQGNRIFIKRDDLLPFSLGPHRLGVLPGYVPDRGRLYDNIWRQTFELMQSPGEYLQPETDFVLHDLYQCGGNTQSVLQQPYDGVDADRGDSLPERRSGPVCAGTV